MPANHHDDLDACLDLDPGLLADVRECGLFYDEDGHGRYLHLVTEVLGSRVFFEVVQRIGGYGAVNAPAWTAAHRRLRTAPE
jgi:4-hydroxyphenylpyruvate dioxygenase